MRRKRLTPSFELCWFGIDDGSLWKLKHRKNLKMSSLFNVKKGIDAKQLTVSLNDLLSALYCFQNSIRKILQLNCFLTHSPPSEVPRKGGLKVL